MKYYYPLGTEKILDFYKGEYASCFILFHPFIKMANEQKSKDLDRTSASQEETLPDDLKDLFKGISLPGNALIYAANQNYPKDMDIIENGRSVSWNEILGHSDLLSSYGDIQKGLKTSIGAYRKIFQRPDLSNAVKQVLDSQKLWPPKEDDINPLTRIRIFEIFKLLSLENIVNFNYGQDIVPQNISKLNAPEFCEAFKSNILFSENKEVMISQGRDTFFCLLLTKDKRMMQKISDNFQLEGILCDEETNLPWDMDVKELESMWKIEKQQKERKKQKQRRPWWKSLFGK